MTANNHPIAFLPGWAFKAEIFWPIAQHFEHHSCHFIDWPALEKPDELIVSNINNLIPKNSILIAWSLGGLIATLLCAQHPFKFKKLILINSTPKFSSDDNWPGISNEDITKFSLKAKLKFDNLIHYFLQLSCWPSKDKHLYDFLHKHVLKNQNSLLHYLKFLFETDARKPYQQLSIPTLEIRSLNDVLVPANHPHLNRHYLLKGGHASFLTHLPQTVSYIKQFIYAK